MLSPSQSAWSMAIGVITRAPAGHHVGGVEPAAEPHLQDDGVGGMLGEGQEGGRRRDLEERDGCAGVGALGALQHARPARPRRSGAPCRRRRRARCARGSAPGAARCRRGRACRPPAAWPSGSAAVEPLPLVPAMWMTGGRRCCGLPSLASSASMRPSDRSISRGCSAFSSASSSSLVRMAPRSTSQANAGVRRPRRDVS